MGFFVETVPIDLEAAHIHEQMPEFKRNPPEDILIVDEGKIAVGSIGNRFRSEGFDSCFGIAIEDPFSQIFGFFHVYPGQELTEDDIRTLTPLRTASRVLFKGQTSQINAVYFAL